ncbi:MAG: a-glycosyltransferase, Glycosyltransferase Family 4-like protein [Labilithrix sp.]|nr:a-glycosyltransferase, Glycosyltransferase Family 4-like protein [Labilithrix sp.]
MRIVLFCHSLLSDWNHGNAHFLRGVVTELQQLGHTVDVYEPRDAWSLENLLRDHGPAAIDAVRETYPSLVVHQYEAATLDLDEALDHADVVLVHEWSPHELVARVGAHRLRAREPYQLYFHDTHHRSVTEPDAMAAYDLRGYDGVLAFGAAVQQQYLRKGWAQQVHVWHEAADTRVFRPRRTSPDAPYDGDLVWVGNWGDDERARELVDMLMEPAHALGLRAVVHGVRYPEHALASLAAHGIEFRGWLANHRAPELFARYRMTVHVPRRPYAQALPGIPTIRVFEALACGIPLISAPWEDREGLFAPGRDYLVAADPAAMKKHMQLLRDDADAREELAAHGLATILRRHTCRHRALELLAIVEAQLAPHERVTAPVRLFNRPEIGS